MQELMLAVTDNLVGVAIARLNHVKDAMKAVPPRMTVMPDDEFEKHKLKDFFTGDSLFETIDSKFENVYKMTPEQKAKIQNAPDAPQKEDEVLDLFEKIDKVNVAQDNEPLSSLLNALEEAEKNIHFGSAEYQNVKEAVRQLAEANMKLSSDDKFVSKKMFENLGKAYANVENICNKYINRKEKQGKLEASGKTGKRISAVKKVKSYCANKVMSIGLIVNPSPEKSEIAEMVRKEKYAVEYNAASGAVAARDNEATLNSSDEKVIEMIYSLVASELKVKLDELHRIVDSLKTVLTSRLSEAKITQMGAGLGE